MVTAAACAVILGIFSILSTQVRAAGLNVGASTWYMEQKVVGPTDDEVTSAPTLMYGPVAGVDFADRWSVTSVLLTGNIKIELNPGMTDFQFRRYDSDTSLSYSIFRWLKVFGGFKYLRFDYRDDNSEVTIFGGAERKHYTYGPGLGIGLTVPLLDSFYALANVSGMCLTGKESIEGTEDYRYKEKGYNIAASLAYYMDYFATTLSAGVRYQYLDSNHPNSDIGDSKSKFFGVTLSAVRHFSLDSAE